MGEGETETDEQGEDGATCGETPPAVAPADHDDRHQRGGHPPQRRDGCVSSRPAGVEEVLGNEEEKGTDDKEERAEREKSAGSGTHLGYHFTTI